jgi:hypothetical protein
VSAASPSDAERTAGFLIERVRVRRGRLWNEGPRKSLAGIDAPAGRSEAPSGPALALLAAQRVRGVSDGVVRGLLAWDRGLRAVDLLRVIPTADEMLARQAQGRRCVSLLDDDVAAAHGDPRHPDGLSFVLHDLEHLEKFVAPEHHVGQVGFFRAVRRAFADPRFCRLQSQFDAAWFADRDYVISDMNGSAIFLFACLKMKVNMAVRRQLAIAAGRNPRDRGPLDAIEREALAPALQTLIDALGLPAPARDAALLVSARRDDPVAARTLLDGFEALARAPLSS